MDIARFEKSCRDNKSSAATESSPVNQKAQEEEERLCCCEFIDQDGGRNHLLALCCDCELVDDACERFISRRPVPPELWARLLSVIADRVLRVPRFGGGGAMRLRADVLVPIVAVPCMIFVAAQGPIWSFCALVGIPLALILVYSSKCPFGRNINGGGGGGGARSSFFVVWALSSLVFLEGVMEIEVLPFLDIFFLENMLIKFFLAVTLFCLHRVRRDPGILERSSGIDGQKPSSLQLYDGSDIENLRRCVICDVLQVGRAGHCRTCNVCILRRDHHCVWIDVCIGAKNHQSFIVGLVFLSLTLWYGCHLTLTTICQPVLVFELFLFPQDCRGVYENIHLAVCFVSAIYALMILCITTMLLLYQVYLISRNLTIAESRRLKLKRSPFSKGLIRNWLRFWSGPI